jgi:hypothetical protein
MVDFLNEYPIMAEASDIRSTEDDLISEELPNVEGMTEDSLMKIFKETSSRWKIVDDEHKKLVKNFILIKAWMILNKKKILTNEDGALGLAYTSVRRVDLKSMPETTKEQHRKKFEVIILRKMF